jgi:hypothetical protein
MSYILDALKKAEQERGNPQLQTVAGGRADRTAYRYRWWPVAGALVLCVVAMICFVLFYSKPGRQAPEPSHVGVSRQPEAGLAIVPSEQKQEPAGVAIPTRAPENAQEKPVENRKEESKAIQTAPKQNDQPNQRATVHPEPPPAEATAPMPLREAIQKMKITVLMYSEVPSERVVFINGKKYSEGDSVEGCYLLEKITMGGVELSYMGERALLRP